MRQVIKPHWSGDITWLTARGKRRWSDCLSWSASSDCLRTQRPVPWSACLHGWNISMCPWLDYYDTLLLLAAYRRTCQHFVWRHMKEPWCLLPSKTSVWTGWKNCVTAHFRWQETEIHLTSHVTIGTLRDVPTAASNVPVFSPSITLSQRGATARSTQHHMEENQIYASADEGKYSTHMVLSSPPFLGKNSSSSRVRGCVAASETAIRKGI